MDKVNILGQRHFLHRMRFQLFGGLAFAILLPTLLRMSFDPKVIFSPNMQTTLVAAIIAHAGGYLLHKRIGNFPGVAAAGYILPTFVLSYGFVFLTIFFFRFDYSRLQAATSFLQSILWYFGLSVATRRLEPDRLAIIPEGDIDSLLSIKGIIWHKISSPTVVYGDANGVVADLRADLSAEWERYIADRALSGIPVYHVKQIKESLTGRVEIHHLSENTLGSINPNLAYFALKHSIDFVAAILMLLVLFPVLAVISIAIVVDTRGPAFYRQTRVGYRGKPYTVYKFRSMVVSTDSMDDRDKAITKVADQRVTRVGAVIRKFRLDELPQAINILRGEMSWIGPRPEALVLSKWYEEELPFYRYRHIVRPGITGWAQVNQGHVAGVDDVLEKLHYDFYYIKNFSPWLDVLIVFRTVRTILTGFGSR